MDQVYYVHPNGQDNWIGSIDQPFKTINKGVSVLMAGDTLNIHTGRYLEEVRIVNKMGTAENPIIIQSIPGHSVIIENTLPIGRTGTFSSPNDDWKKASDTIPDAHPDEYISAAPIHSSVGKFFVRGMFLNRSSYTRLITYSNLNDFRSNNETFEKIFNIDDERQKIQATDSTGQPALSNLPNVENEQKYPYWYPFVYMGPGIWPNKSTGHLHIRLSHTNNQVTGIEDYTGTIDPRELPLGIAFESTITLRIAHCSYVTIRNMEVRYGGEKTIHSENNRNLTLTGLSVLCGSYGIVNSKSENLLITNTSFNGGLPPWYFRTDRKNEYSFLNTETGEVDENNLGKNTVLSILSLNDQDVGTKITNCEFLNGHDCTLKGELEFSKNYIRNMNDDALFISESFTSSVKVFQNVFTKCLYCISLAEKAQPGAAPLFIYRNLFDLRESTAGFRPRYIGDKDVWRKSMFLKTGSGDTGIQMFHNTLIALSPPSLHAIFGPFVAQKITQPTVSFNNLFAADYSIHQEGPKALVCIPPPESLFKTDGNFYSRDSKKMPILARSYEYTFEEQTYRSKSYKSLAEFYACKLFTHSQTIYNLGYEKYSKEGDPKFKSIFFSFKRPFLTDDFRLRKISFAKDCGIALPADLQALDIFPAVEKPAAGCYPLNAKPMRVGVDGKKCFPTISL